MTLRLSLPPFSSWTRSNPSSRFWTCLSTFSLRGSLKPSILAIIIIIQGRPKPPPNTLQRTTTTNNRCVSRPSAFESRKRLAPVPGLQWRTPRGRIYLLTTAAGRGEAEARRSKLVQGGRKANSFVSGRRGWARPAPPVHRRCVAPPVLARPDPAQTSPAAASPPTPKSRGEKRSAQHSSPRGCCERAAMA